MKYGLRNPVTKEYEEKFMDKNRILSYNEEFGKDLVVYQVDLDTREAVRDIVEDMICLCQDALSAKYPESRPDISTADFCNKHPEVIDSSALNAFAYKVLGYFLSDLRNQGSYDLFDSANRLARKETFPCD